MTAPHPPSIDALSRLLPVVLPAGLRVSIARAAVEHSRRDPTVDPVAETQRLGAHLTASRQRPVINATGVILHTNLGRAPLDETISQRAADAASRYTNLELDLEDGSRGGRMSYVISLLCALTGADDALVVNNNAAALFLSLMAMASGRSVPVSRGELIEIGGSYRLPDLMASTGTRLVEVGTTNRTRIDDYREAIDDTTALLLKVHPSNYRIEGFAEEADLASVIELAHSHAVPAVFDAGSGLLDERTPWLPGPTPAWLAGEPGIVQSLEAGADLVMFSGDKLLGGPQAGIIVGDGDLVAGLRRHPVTRALRMDGSGLAALEATLEAYADRRAAELPLWSMATMSAEALSARSEVVVGSLEGASIIEGASTIGAGSVPGSRIRGPVIRVAGRGETDFISWLRADPPVVARRDAGDLIVDLRTVRPDDDQIVAELLRESCRS
ncbi:MAG: L-seryl-tRNA(Sec) selenium transferase [Acidimicrobiia bacterium]